MNAQQHPTLFQLATINRLLPLTDCRLHAAILRWLATYGADFISSWDRRKWNPFTAISLNFLAMRVNVKDSHDLFSCNYLFFNWWKDFQKWIGYVDVKSEPVHFYVQRNSSFSTQDTPIPFEFAWVNEGNAMDLPSGIFTAPRPGIYFFSFTGVAYLKSSSWATFDSYLYLNGNRIGTSNVKEQNAPIDQYNPLTLQSTLNLQKGDRVWVQINYYPDSSLYLADYPSSHLTHFTGFMLEEEIVASLWGSGRHDYTNQKFAKWTSTRKFGEGNFKGKGKKMHSTLIH